MLTKEKFSARYFSRAFAGAKMPNEQRTFLDIADLAILRHDVLDKVFLAGGCFRFLYEPHGKVNDFDVFFGHGADIDSARSFFRSYGYDEVFICPKGELFTFKKNDVKVQLINVRRYDSVEQLINTFDFTATMFGTDFRNFVFDDRAPTAALTKTIELNAVEFPVATLNRMMKYMRYGFKLGKTTFEQFVTEVYTMGVRQQELNPRYYVD